MPLNPCGLDVISQLKKYLMVIMLLVRHPCKESKKNSTKALYDKWSTPNMSSPSLTKCHLPMSFPLFQLCRCLFGFPPPSFPCLGFGFQDSKTQDQINTFLEPPPHSVNISMTCFAFFCCTFIHILIISRERKQNLCVQVIP